MQRNRRVAIVLAALLAISMLVTACGTGGGSKELTFGMILVGPQDDHGWSEAHYQAGKYVEANVEGSKMIALDNLNAAGRPGVTLEQVVDDMVDQGASLIFVTSDDFQADTDPVAEKYPDVNFVMVTGDHAKTGEAPENVANYMGNMTYGKAIAGCAAALKTETGTIGYLGPLINDETRRLTSAAYLGCRDCYERYRGGNPDDIEFIVTWIGFWFNIPGVTLDPTEVANDLFNQGVDVLISGIDTTEAIVVAGQRADRGENVWAIPYDYENACEVKPEICLGTPYFNWGPQYVRYVEAAKQGEFEQEFVWEDPYWKDINDHDNSPVGYVMGAGLSDEDVKNLEEYIDDLAKGNVKLFSGPLKLQDGTMYVEDGKDATADQIWYLPQLVEGMTGDSE